MLSDCNIFCSLGGGEKRQGPMPMGRFLFFFWWSLTPDLRFSLGLEQILAASFTTQVRARILSDRNIFGTLGEGQQRRGLMPLGLFLFFFLVVTCPDLWFFLGQTNNHCVFQFPYTG